MKYFKYVVIEFDITFSGKTKMRKELVLVI